MNVVQLDIPTDAITIADLFGILENEKNNYNILYYTVSQTTLDTVRYYSFRIKLSQSRPFA